MTKPIATFTKQIVLPVIQAIIIVLLTISTMAFAFPAYSQEKSLTDLQTRALVLNKQGKYSEAVKVAKEALKASEEEFGSDHPKTAAS